MGVDRKDTCKKPGFGGSMLIIFMATTSVAFFSTLVAWLAGSTRTVKATTILMYGALVGSILGLITALVQTFRCEHHDYSEDHPKKKKKKKHYPPAWCDDHTWLWLWLPLALGALLGGGGGYMYGESHGSSGTYGMVGLILGVSIPLITASIIINTTCYHSK